MFKNIFLKTIFIFLAIFLLSAPILTQAAAPVNLYFFYSKTCPHCQKEELFLSQLKKSYGDQINIKSFEVTENYGNVKLFQKFQQTYSAIDGGFAVPSLFIGDKNILGYYNDEYTGVEIKNKLDQCLKLGCPDLGAAILADSEKKDTPAENPNPNISEQSKKITVPIFGAIDLQKTSLLVATIAIGALDGFNPCAMWILIFLISLLLGTPSVKRRWLLGLTFIIASGLVYFLFMTAWLNVFLFLGYVQIIRIVIGLIALGFGVYNLRKYLRNRAGVCEVSDSTTHRKIMDKLKAVALSQNIFLAMAGLIVLAIAVNAIELACSAGFPAIYTKMLSMHDLSAAGYYAYLALYILLFILDDVIIFVIAMITLRLTGIDAKYSKYSDLIGGAVIAILGILLILKPAWLMFG